MTVYRTFRLDPGIEAVEVDRDTNPRIAHLMARDLAAVAPADTVFVVRTFDGTMLASGFAYCRADDYRTSCNGGRASGYVSDAIASTPVCAFHLRRDHGIPVRDPALDLNPELYEFDAMMTGSIAKLCDDPESAVAWSDIEDHAQGIAEAFGQPHDLVAHRLAETVRAAGYRITDDCPV